MSNMSRSNKRAHDRGRLRRLARQIHSALVEWRNSDGLDFAPSAAPATHAKADARGRTQRQQEGMAALKQITGGDGRELVERLRRLSPAFSDLLIEDTYGAIISRPNLSLKSRELATVAALTTVGHVPWALKLHCAGMLNTGWGPRAVAETIVMACAGQSARRFEAAAHVAREVMDEREQREGENVIEPQASQPIPADLRALACKVCEGSMHCAVLNALGAMRAWQGSPLSAQERQMVELASALAGAKAPGEIGAHLQACLSEGWTREQLTEVLMHMTAYLGWPAVLNALKPATDLFERMEQPT